MFVNVDDGWTTDAWLYYKIAYEPKGSGELIKVKKEKLKANVVNFSRKRFITLLRLNVSIL